MTNVPAQYQGYVDSAASALGIPSSVVAAQINLESGFNPNARSGAGAEGIAQFIPGTWRAYGHGSPYNVTDAFNAYVNYMRSLLSDFHGDLRSALAAYNAGPGNIKAGMGYANKILSASGTGNVTTSGSAAPGGSGGGDPSQSMGIYQQLGNFGSLFFTGGADGLAIGGLGSLFSGAGNVAGAIGSLTNDVSVFIKMISVLLKPSFWLRVASFFTGILLAFVGVWFLVSAMRNK